MNNIFPSLQIILSHIFQVVGKVTGVKFSKYFFLVSLSFGSLEILLTAD